MKTVRRLYFYAVALISLEFVLWGLINLLRSIVDQTVGGGAVALASALALILVGVPILLFHWLWAQRLAARDAEEKTAALRAIFLYSTLIGTLIPLVQNLLALIDRGLLQLAGLDSHNALFGSVQTWPDNLIAILMNAVVAAYFWSVLRGEWRTLPPGENFADIRRLYRYIWVLYGLLMAVFGAQQILGYGVFVLAGTLGDAGRDSLINGLSLLIVGTPVWVYAWRVVQDSLTDPAELDSNLRLSVLYLLALAGVITVLSAATSIVNTLLLQFLGAHLLKSDLIQNIGGPLSIALPLGALWAYYGTWLRRHIASFPDPLRRAALRRTYFYILSALGLAAAFTGIALLINFLIDFLNGALLTDEGTRMQLAGAVALILGWLPLWLLAWSPMQGEAFTPNEVGDDARRSVVRKAYLYLALFAGVIGGMAMAVTLVFELLRALLTGQTEADFVTTLLKDGQLLVLFAILLLYHLNILRRDNAATSDSLASKQKDFPVLAFDSPAGFGQSVNSALARSAPGIPLTVATQASGGNFRAIVLAGSAALSAPDWVRQFKGSRIIVPDAAEGIVWAGSLSPAAVDQAAQALRQLAETGQVSQRAAPGSAWRVVVNIAAALFGLEFLLLLSGLLFALLGGR
jgi:hypothetical protein